MHVPSGICGRGAEAHKGLVINYGEGGHTTGRGHVKSYPYKKGGGGKSLSHAEGGVQNVLV